MGKNRIIVTAVAIATAANSLIPMAGAASVTDYTDYNANAWHTPAVKFVVDNDIMIGTSKTTLTVERNITRAEFVSLIDRFAKRTFLSSKTSLKLTGTLTMWPWVFRWVRSPVLLIEPYRRRAS